MSACGRGNEEKTRKATGMSNEDSRKQHTDDASRRKRLDKRIPNVYPDSSQDEQADDQGVSSRPAAVPKARGGVSANKGNRDSAAPEGADRPVPHDAGRVPAQRTGHQTVHPRTTSQAEVAQYQRNSYEHGGGHHRKRGRRVASVIVFIIVALLLVGGGVAAFLYTRPLHVVVNGVEYEVAWNTTYNKLHDDGIISGDSGNFVAVDGEVLEAGKGGPFKAYANGKLVDDNDSRVKNDATITTEDGDDITEDADVTERSVSWVWDIEDCGRQDTYNFSIGMWVTQGTDGTERTATGKVSGKTVVTTDMVPRMVRHYYTNETGDQKVIALTFDDGPSEFTQQVLDILDKYGAVATFYEVGSKIEEHPETTKAVVEQGSEVGNHSYSHSVFYSADNQDQVCSEVAKTNEIIKDVTGQTCTNIRPPGGFWSDELWKPLEGNCTLCVGGSIDTNDWKRQGVDSIVHAAEQGESGDVILMHDGGGDRSQSVQALDQICAYYKDQGYTFVTTSQLADIERQALRDEGAIPAESTA
jgi:peptidoglycan/xylan/chitin deacetylase (PgdA/CDA1 family)